MISPQDYPVVSCSTRSHAGSLLIVVSLASSVKTDLHKVSVLSFCPVNLSYCRYPPATAGSSTQIQSSLSTQNKEQITCSWWLCFCYGWQTMVLKHPNPSSLLFSVYIVLQGGEFCFGFFNCRQCFLDLCGLEF